MKHSPIENTRTYKRNLKFTNRKFTTTHTSFKLLIKNTHNTNPQKKILTKPPNLRTAKRPEAVVNTFAVNTLTAADNVHYDWSELRRIAGWQLFDGRVCRGADNGAIFKSRATSTPPAWFMAKIWLWFWRRAFRASRVRVCVSICVSDWLRFRISETGKGYRGFGQCIYNITVWAYFGPRVFGFVIKTLFFCFYRSIGFNLVR